MKPRRKYTLIPVEAEKPTSKPVSSAEIDAAMRKFEREYVKPLEDFRKRPNAKK